MPKLHSDCVNGHVVGIEHDLDVNHYGGIELDDLLQEGRLAILEAAVSYAVNSDTKFSTYASTVM